MPEKCYLRPKFIFDYYEAYIIFFIVDDSFLGRCRSAVVRGCYEIF